MRHAYTIDWVKLFAPQMSPLEIVVRGVVVYLSLCLMLRVVLKRQAGRVSLSDLLVVTLVAGVCRNPLIADSYTITDGLLVVAVVLFCSFAVDWLCYYVPVVHTLMHPPPRPLIRDGEILMGNLRRELMTVGQLRSKLRHDGVRDPEEVAEAYLEGDGQVTVIKKEPHANGDSGSAEGTTGPGASREGRPEMAELVQAMDRLRQKVEWYQQQVEKARIVPDQRGDKPAVGRTNGRDDG